MKNSEYWKGRFKVLEAAANTNAALAYHNVEQHYNSALRKIENDIRVWYQRFATNNKVTMAEAKRMLNAKELAELKWDVKEYIKYGKQLDLNPTWIKQLENASARFHISRLEALKLQTQQSAEVLFGNKLDVIDGLMQRIYSDGYYHTVFEIQKGFNVGWDIVGVDQGRLSRIISKPWAADGKNFSSRIWANKQRLITELHAELTRGCILGTVSNDTIKNIAKKMNTSRNNAGRLVMTESAYFSSISQKDAFNDLNVERFEIVATLDSHTSVICQEMDGKAFPMKDFEAGVTAPPFHVWCRSCTVPYFEDGYGGERAARGKDGKTYYVPDSMKYPDWKKTFTEGGSKDSLKPADVNGIIKLSTNQQRALNEYISSGSYKINAVLRGGAGLSDQQGEFVCQLDAALEKMPSYQGTVFRSISTFDIDDLEGFWKKQTPNTVLKFPAYTSSSTKVYDTSFPIQYVIQSKTGRDIRAFNQRELEIVFLRDTEFLIIKVEDNTIFMEELL